MTCRHRKIRTWVFEDTREPAGMWSCIDCGIKFVPIIETYPKKDNSDLLSLPVVELPLETK